MRSRILRSPHTAPVVSVLALFAASRVWAWDEGVRFGPSPLVHSYWQELDPRLLEHHLLQSIWYLHSQPPLFNLLLGIGLKVFGGSFVSAAHVIQVGLGIGIAVALYSLCIVLGVPRWWAAAVAALLAVSPAMIIYENWLFYEYVVAGLLLFSALAFVALERRPSASRSGLLFTLLVAICLIRSSFQILLPLIVLAFVLWLFRGHRRELLVGAAVPMVILLALLVKNWALFGTPSTSSWFGMNLAQVDQFGFLPGEQRELQSKGIIGPILRIRAFSPLPAYKSLVHPSSRYASIPALHDQVKPDVGDARNLNNFTYITISNKYMHDWVQVLLHRPTVYLRGIETGMKKAAWPSTDYPPFVANRGKIEPWVRGYNTVVLWQPQVAWHRGWPSGRAYGIIIFYITSILFGAVETLRVLRRRCGSALIAFLWLLLAYATFAMTFGEASENQRIRFVTDPIVAILVTVAVARLARKRWPRQSPAVDRTALID